MDRDEGGLESALDELASSTSKLAGISCSFISVGPVEIRDNARAVHVFRIAQEALSNATKHGQAKGVVIALEASDGALSLRVSDDGIGFDQTCSERKGMGLNIMRYAERALRSGATGYITKHESADNVLLAIRRVLAGEVYLSGKLTSVFLKSLTGGLKSVPRPLDRLTDRELEVLELIGRGHTTRQIAETLQLGVATVDTYRARIKEKMNFRNATELQHFAIRWVRERE